MLPSLLCLYTQFIPIADALGYCHAHKVIHRDLKTLNIFLTEHDEVRLGDFGIARVLEHTAEMATTTVGTPYNMSPEVCENKPYSAKSDVWALGCVLFEMCSLNHPFEGTNLLNLVWKIVKEEYEPVALCYSDELDDMIGWMLEKRFDDRPTIRQILEDPIIVNYLVRSRRCVALHCICYTPRSWCRRMSVLLCAHVFFRAFICVAPRTLFSFINSSCISIPFYVSCSGRRSCLNAPLPPRTTTAHRT
jgi:serine/threonine protein kinase